MKAAIPARRASRFAAVVLAAAAFAGCAAIDGAGGGPSPDTLSVARGRAIADLRCAICHATEPSGDSPRLMAPPLRTVSMSYSRLAFTKRMAQLAGDGAHDMPGYDLSRDDFDDLIAYLESQRTRAPNR